MRPARQAVLLLLVLAVAGCSTSTRAEVEDRTVTARRSQQRPVLTSWVYQLQGYRDGRLDALARSPHQLAVIDLARDAHTDYFRRGEVRALRRSGKRVLAYFEIGSIESFRPEYPHLRQRHPDLILNRWDEWPEEYFVKYWTDRWWRLVVRPRVDRALTAGYGGVYLDTPVAYEEIPLRLADGHSRSRLGRQMVDLIMRIERYAHRRRPGFWIVPQNSPELYSYHGYLRAIDGIGMEELFYRATDKPCTAGWCGENLRNTRRIRDAGKLVLAVDYAVRPRSVRRACARYAREGFAGYVTTVALNRIKEPCTRER